LSFKFKRNWIHEASSYFLNSIEIYFVTFDSVFLHRNIISSISNFFSGGNKINLVLFCEAGIWIQRVALAGTLPLEPYSLIWLFERWGSLQLFAQAGLQLWSSWSEPPKQLGWLARATDTQPILSFVIPELRNVRCVSLANWQMGGSFIWSIIFTHLLSVLSNLGVLLTEFVQIPSITIDLCSLLHHKEVITLCYLLGEVLGLQQDQEKTVWESERCTDERTLLHYFICV
jgi:hypothetical protein